MPYSTTATTRTCLVLVALALSCLPAAAADTLVADQSALTFAHVSGQQNPASQTIAVSLSSGDPLTNLSYEVTTGDARFTDLFIVNPTSSGVSVSVNAGILGNLEVILKVAKPYTATLKLKSTQAPNQPTVSLSVTEAASVAFSVSPASMTFSAPPLSTALLTQNLQVTSASTLTQYTATASSTGNWLAVNPPGGTGSGQLAVLVNPTSLTAGTYTGNVVVAPLNTSIPSQTVNVTLTIGSSGSLSFSPSSLNFSYSTSGAATPPADQFLTIQSSNPNVTLFAQPTNANWLKVNNGKSVVSVTLPSTLTIGIDVTGITASPAGPGYISIVGSDGSLASIPVTLTVNSSTSGAISLSTNAMTFSGPVGFTPSAQSLAISTTASSAVFTATSGAAWLYVGATPGAASYAATGTAYLGIPGNLYVSVNPSGLIAGPNYGTITVASGAASYSVFVTYMVGGSGGSFGVLQATPAQLSFAMQSSGSAPPVQQFAVTGTSGTSLGAVSSAAWLSATPSSDSIPANVSVAINAASAPTGAGTYSGTITVTSGSQTALVTVNLTVAAGAVLVANPGSIVINYDPASAGSSLYQIINLRSSGGDGSYSAVASNSALLTLYGQTGNTPGNIGVLINQSALSPGANTASITITFGSTSTTIPVTVIVAGGGGSNPGVVSLSPASMAFTTTVGNSPAAQNLSVSTSQAYATFTALATSTGSWLSVSPTSSIVGAGVPVNLAVSVSAATLGAGTYTGSITVSSGGIPQTVTVSLTVSSSGGGGGTTPQGSFVEVERGNFNFVYNMGDAVPPAQDWPLSSNGGQFSYTATASSTGGWLAISPTQGLTQSTLKVSVNPQGLSAGTYNGTVSVASPYASNSPLTRNVILVVKDIPKVSASPASLTYTYHTTGGVPPSAQNVAVTSTNGSLSYTASADANWITVSQAGGTTPGNVSVGVDPSGLAPGQYSGKVTIVSGGNTSSATVDVSLTVTAPLPTVTKVVSAASYQAGPLAGGLIVAISGEFIGPDTPVTQQLDSNGRVATTLGDVQVFFSGYPAPLTMVSGKEIKAVVPYAMAARTTASVWVSYQGLRSNAVPVQLAPSAPGILTMDETGAGQGVIANADGSANSASNAAARGSNVTINVTGAGQTDPAGVDGKIHTVAGGLPKPVLPVSVLIDGKQARVVDYGATPDLVSGNMRIVVEVPADSATGTVSVSVQIGTVVSRNGVTMAVK